MITKEQIQQEAEKLGLKLTDEEITQFEKDQKLPEKESDEPPENFDEKTAWKMIKELRAENKERRIKEKKANDKLTEKEKAEEKAKREADEQKGEFKKLYDEAKQKLDTFEPLVNEYNTYKEKKRQDYKKLFGDKWIDSFATIPLGELEALAVKILPKEVLDVNSNNHQRTPEPPKKDRKYLVDYKEQH